MSDISATITSIEDGFHIEGYEKITYDFRFVDNIFDPEKSDLADRYRTWKLCLIIIDDNVHKIYGQSIEKYFSAYQIKTTIKIILSGELQFSLVRKESVLVIGGGVLTGVAGYACASYRRTSNFIRILLAW